MRVLIGLLCLGALLGPTSAPVLATSLGEYVRDELGRLAASPDPGEEVCYASEVTETWRMRRFYLTLRPEVGFTMGVAQITIQPSIQLMWQERLPDDWVPYHP